MERTTHLSRVETNADLNEDRAPDVLGAVRASGASVLQPVTPSDLLPDHPGQRQERNDDEHDDDPERSVEDHVDSAI
jgi:hypothetical protein